MFKSSKVFSGFSVDDLDQAKEFYQNVLGLMVERDEMGFLELHTHGNNPIVIYPKPDHQPATFTILNFPVDDIDAAVSALNQKGIDCLQYTGQLQTDANGICRGSREDGTPHIAWFKDPAGNILSVLEIQQQLA